MSAIEQGAGGGAPAPGAPAPAGTAPAPAPTPNQQQQPGNEDPWGFSQHVANAPEHLRESLQAILNNGIAPQLQERMAPFEQLQPRMERIAPLLEADEHGNTTLDGLLTIFDLFNDPDRVEDFQDWWESVGDEFEFFDDGDRSPGQGQGEGAAGAPDGVDLSALDPAAQAIVQQLQETVQGLEARLGEFETTNENTQREQAVSDAAAEIRTELTTLMQQHRIDGHDNLESPQAQDILRLAQSYGPDPKAIEKATNDYLRITGGAQSQTLQNQGQPVSGVDALRAALAGGGQAPPRAPGPALGAGGPANEPEAVRGFDDAKAIAMDRYTKAHGR